MRHEIEPLGTAPGGIDIACTCGPLFDGRGFPGATLEGRHHGPFCPMRRRVETGSEGSEGHVAILRGYAWFCWETGDFWLPRPLPGEKLCEWSKGDRIGEIRLTLVPKLKVPPGWACEEWHPIGESCIYSDGDLTVFAARKLGEACDSGGTVERWLYVSVLP